MSEIREFACRRCDYRGSVAVGHSTRWGRAHDLRPCLCRGCGELTTADLLDEGGLACLICGSPSVVLYGERTRKPRRAIAPGVARIVSGGSVPGMGGGDPGGTVVLSAPLDPCDWGWHLCPQCGDHGLTFRRGQPPRKDAPAAAAVLAAR